MAVNMLEEFKTLILAFLVRVLIFTIFAFFLFMFGRGKDVLKFISVTYCVIQRFE